MADLNALIAQGAQFRVPPPVDPMGNMPQLMQMRAAQNQNELAQYQLGAARRTDEQQSALNALARDPNFNPNTPEGMRQAQQFGAPGYALVKSAREASLAGVTQNEAQVKLALEKQKHLGQMYRDISSRPSDANITAHAEDVEASPMYTPEEKTAVRTKAERLLAMPMADRMAMLSGQGISAGELSTAATAKAGQGVTMRGQDIVADTAAAGQRVTARGQDIVAGTAKAGQGVTMRGQDIVARTAATGQDVTARGQDIGAATARAAQAQALDLANRPVYDAASGGFVSRPTAAQPAGAFTPLPAVKVSQDQRAALKALKTAGYDPETGEDNISKLINESTSGGLQAATAATLGFFDVTTSGMKAIGALAGTANQMALDVAGGKLGAGISNADRDFIVSTLGDVANPYKTADQRLASWTAAKDRMVQSGMIPPPNQPKPGAPTRENAAKITNPSYPGFSVVPGGQ